MRARRDNPTGADPQGAVARAESFGADHYDPLAAAVAEARLVERARIVKWLRGEATSPFREKTGRDAMAAAAERIDEGAHLVEVTPARR